MLVISLIFTHIYHTIFWEMGLIIPPYNNRNKKLAKLTQLMQYQDSNKFFFPKTNSP